MLLLVAEISAGVACERLPQAQECWAENDPMTKEQVDLGDKGYSSSRPLSRARSGVASKCGGGKCPVFDPTACGDNSGSGAVNK